MNKIDSFRNEFQYLSNFYEAPVAYNGLTYRNNEAAFQAQKTLDEKKRMFFTQMKPSEAKSAGRRVILRKDWEDVKISIMHDIVEAKFRQNPSLAAKLISTGSVYLEEGNTWGDKTWGTVDGKGANNLGRILMDVREELIREKIQEKEDTDYKRLITICINEKLSKEQVEELRKAVLAIAPEANINTEAICKKIWSIDDVRAIAEKKGYNDEALVAKAVANMGDTLGDCTDDEWNFIEDCVDTAIEQCVAEALVTMNKMTCDMGTSWREVAETICAAAGVDCTLDSTEEELTAEAIKAYSSLIRSGIEHASILSCIDYYDSMADDIIRCMPILSEEEMKKIVNSVQVLHDYICNTEGYCMVARETVDRLWQKFSKLPTDVFATGHFFGERLWQHLPDAYLKSNTSAIVGDVVFNKEDKSSQYVCRALLKDNMNRGYTVFFEKDKDTDTIRASICRILFGCCISPSAVQDVEKSEESVIELAEKISNLPLPL